MRSVIRDVHEFMSVGKQAIGDKPGIPAMDNAARYQIGDVVGVLHRYAVSLKAHGSGDVAAMRARLLCEELAETLTAISARDAVETADGLADLVYVAVGTAIAFGIDLDPVWKAVQRSNMAKFPACEKCSGHGWIDNLDEAYVCPACGGAGRIRHVDASGKITKPIGWIPPNISAIIEAQRKRT
ncbi:MAG: hypothetical protein A2Y38_19590 [Spirochaetes bacterium GWB1_59_5]|nr:MAG: hypothetical protein A2Y38_19590 [Spirochaetes bacterium GWB1_59_5]